MLANQSKTVAMIKENKTLQGYLLSFVITVMLAIHLLTSDVVIAGKQNDSVKNDAAEQNQPAAEQHLPNVETERVAAVEIEKELQLYGRTEANRTAEIKTELAASINDIELEEGQLIQAGETVAALSTPGLPERLAHGKALVEQRELEYQSSLSLQEQGYQARLMLAEKATLLAEAKASLAGLQKEYDDSHITVPFSGVLNKLYVEQGDYLQSGDVVAEVLEMNPLIVKINVPETEVDTIAKGQKAEVEFLDGSKHEAVVTYISANSVMGTNTFEVEMRLPNDDLSIPAGISSKVTLFTKPVTATPVSPSYLTLDDEGRSGIYVVENNIARFKIANILKSNAQQLWVESVGDVADIIIAGHQSVLDGAAVELVNSSKTSNQRVAKTATDQSLVGL